jgi:hypothetical protein
MLITFESDLNETTSEERIGRSRAPFAFGVLIELYISL